MNDFPSGGVTREYAGGKMLAAKDDGVGLITFNQPEKRNAMSLEMWTGFGDILDEFAEDGSVRVVILTGAGHKAFVSGADISQFEKSRSDASAQQEYERLAGVGRAKYAAFPKPIIARIVVVLPAPLGPISPQTSPGITSSERSRTAHTLS